jgi:serine protease inhibitor
VKYFIILLLAPVLILTTSCSKEPEGPKQPKPINLTAKGQNVITASNGFGIDLFRATASKENQNPMLSPLSASTALTMLLNGCNADTNVDFVKQNTFVDVNEEGTEAAAVTTIGIKEVSMPPSFVADRPFVFAIRERITNTILFIGKVEHPLY